jgi:hypothetical protein
VLERIEQLLLVCPHFRGLAAAIYNRDEQARAVRSVAFHFDSQPLRSLLYRLHGRLAWLK